MTTSHQICSLKMDHYLLYEDLKRCYWPIKSWHSRSRIRRLAPRPRALHAPGSRAYALAIAGSIHDIIRQVTAARMTRMQLNPRSDPPT